ncbi:MAG: hypothetical protein CM15mP117_09030 [Alphaproteobacteria bacterium]|nr:MAG: hypothetical protein CM15mP117_09030 [Alphaproteobacteria bacterium]
MSKKENALIKLDNAGVRKNRKWLVRGITMSVHSGEIVTLIGPNGSGKTTTAKMALGLLGLNEGTASRKKQFTHWLCTSKITNRLDCSYKS